MSMILMAKAMGVKVGNSTRKLVLLKLCDNANDSGRCYPSYQHIADQCEISRRSAMNHINSLEQSGFIKKTYRKNGDKNSSNVYLITLSSGENSAPSKKQGGETDSLGGENSAPGGETDSLGGGENSAPRTSHSFESVNEPVIEPSAPEASAPVAGSNVVEFQSAKPRVDIPDDMPGPKTESAKTYRAWANYAMCYRNRYGVWPLWNAKVAGQFSNLVDRVGADLAPAVAAHYVRSNNQFYVTKGHAVGPMLNDCESLATQARTGQGMTASKARQLDSTQTNADAAAETKRLLAMDAEAEGWQ